MVVNNVKQATSTTAYANAVKGLSLEQAKLALSTKQLSAIEKEQILIKAGLLNATGKLTTGQLTEILTNKQRNAEDAKALLLSTGLISAETAEATATNIVETAKLEELVATKQLTVAEAELIAMKAKVSTANIKEASTSVATAGKMSGSISILGSSVGSALTKIGSGLLSFASAHPVITALTAIVGLVGITNSQLKKYEQEQKELIENAKTLQDEYRSFVQSSSDNINSLKAQADEFEELSKGVTQYGENISLSADEYDRYKSIVAEVLGYTPELVDGYNAEGTAIANKNSLIERSIELMKEEQRQKLKEMTTDEKTGVAYKGAKAEWDDANAGYEGAYTRNDIGNILRDNEKSSGFWVESDIIKALDLEKEWEDYKKTHTSSSERNLDNFTIDNIEAVAKAIKENKQALTDLTDTKGKKVFSEKEINSLIDKANTWQEQYAEWQQEIEDSKHGMDDQFSLYAQRADGYDDLTDAQRAFVPEYIKATGDIIDADGKILSEDEMIEKAESYEKFVDKLATSPEFADARKKINELFALDSSTISAGEYEKQVNDILEELQTKFELTDDEVKDFKIALGFDFIEDGSSTRVSELVEKVQGKIKDDFDDNVLDLSLDDLVIASNLEIPDDVELSWEDFIKLLNEAKEIPNKITVSFSEAFNSSDFSESKEKLLELAKAGELSPSVLESTEEYKTLLSQTGLLADEAYKKIMNLVSVNDRFADMSSDMSNLANAYKEFKEDGFAKASTLDSLEQFKDLKSYKNFANIVGSKNTTSEQKQKAFNTLATEYLNEERALDKLNETNKDYYITQLKDLGIKNAKIIVEKALNTQEKASNLQAEYRKETGKDLVNVAEELNDATDSEKKSIISATKSFLKMNNATKTARLELFRLNAEEDIFANKDFEGNINLQVEKLFELANAFGVTAAMAKELGIAEDEANRDPLAGGKGYTKADLIHIRESIYKAIYGGFEPDVAQYESNDKSSSSNSSKDSKSKVDWIERKITSITSKIDDLNASYENLFTVKTKNDNISKQLKYQNNLLSANKKAADSYLNAFNGVKLGKDLKNKIINGDYSIKEYSSDNQSLISEAQGYYDNYRKYLREIENTEKSIRENRIKKNQNIIDYSESKTAKYEAQLANTTRYSTKSKLFKNERAEIRTNYDAQIRNAKLNKDKQLEAQLKQQRATELRENFKKDFDALQQTYERKISATEAKYNNIDKKIELLETRGANANIVFYQNEKKINATKLTQLNAEKKALEERLNSIKKGTDEYYEAKEAINEVNNSIQECTKSQYELNKAMTDMLVQRYTDRNDAIQRRIDEDEFIQGLYAGQQKMDKDTASFTKYGKADLDIYAANRLRAKAQADNNEELLNSLKKAEKQADGTYKTSVGGINYIFNSQKELNEAINNTYDNWKDTISSAYDYETKIVDSMKDKYQSQLDLMQELISKKKEALSIEKDLHDYQNQISEKTTNINNLKSQITAYQGDTSLEGMAKLQQLQKSLKEQEKDLRETEYDRFISDQEKMLDNLYEQYEEKIDTIINDFDLLLKQGIKIASTSDVKDTTADVINETANNNGYNTQFDAKDTYNTDNKISTNVKNEATKSNKNADKLSGTESIQKFIKDNVQKTKIKRKDLSYINQLIYDEYGKKVLSTSNLKKLAELVGVKYNGKTKKGNLYKELHSLKIPGFSKGGVVSVDDLYKQIKSNGDTTLASVKSGEGILTPLQTKQFTSLVSQLPNLNQSVIDYKALTRNIKSNPASYNNNVGDIILNIDLPNVTNPDEFVKAIQSSQKLQRTLQSVTIDMMNPNSTRLGVNRIK